MTNTKNLPASRNGAPQLSRYEPHDMKSALEFARVAVESGLVPSAVNTPQKAFIILVTGAELGLPPMQALRSIHVIEGRPCLSAELIVALVKRSPECVWFRLVESTCEVARYATLRRGEPEQTKFSFSMDDAQRASLTNKRVWRNYPDAMLRARASTALARAVYPDLLSGVYLPDELDHYSQSDDASMGDARAEFDEPRFAQPPLQVQREPPVRRALTVDNRIPVPWDAIYIVKDTIPKGWSQILQGENGPKTDAVKYYKFDSVTSRCDWLRKHWVAWSAKGLLQYIENGRWADVMTRDEAIATRDWLIANHAKDKAPVARTRTRPPRIPLGAQTDPELYAKFYKATEGKDVVGAIAEARVILSKLGNYPACTDPGQAAEEAIRGDKPSNAQDVAKAAARIATVNRIKIAKANHRAGNDADGALTFGDLTDYEAAVIVLDALTKKEAAVNLTGDDLLAWRTDQIVVAAKDKVGDELAAELAQDALDAAGVEDGIELEQCAKAITYIKRWSASDE